MGQTVYLAVAPNGTHGFDATALQFRLDTTAVPEPATMLTIGFGLLLLPVLRRRQ